MPPYGMDICRPNQYTAPLFGLAGIAGLEPTKRESKSRVLPLHHIPMYFANVEYTTIPGPCQERLDALTKFCVQGTILENHIIWGIYEKEI